MRQINILARFAPVLILSFGLTGCGSDKKSAPSTNAAAWSVGQVLFSRQPDQPAKETSAQATTVTMKSLQDSLLEFRLSDEIIFPDVGREEGVSVRITATCQSETMTLPPHVFIERMAKRYSIYELLPKEAIFTTSTTPIRCAIEFKAGNQRGDLHEFTLRALPIKKSPHVNPLTIYKNSATIKGDASGPFEIDVTQLSQYRLPTGSPANRDVSKYAIDCTFQTATTTEVVNPPRLDALQYEARKPRLAGEPPLPAKQLCRIFALGQRNRVIQMSEEFVLRSPIRLPEVATTEVPLSTRTMAQTQRQYQIINFSDEPTVYEFAEKNAIEIIVLTSRTGVNGAITAKRVAITPYITVAGVSRVMVGDRVRFKIPPRTNLNVTVDIGSFERIACEAKRAIVGFLVHPAGNNGLSYSVLQRLEPVHDPLNVLLTANLTDYYQEHYPIESSANPVTPLKYIQFPVITAWSHEICWMK